MAEYDVTIEVQGLLRETGLPIAALEMELTSRLGYYVHLEQDDADHWWISRRRGEAAVRAMLEERIAAREAEERSQPGTITEAQADTLTVLAARNRDAAQALGLLTDGTPDRIRIEGLSRARATRLIGLLDDRTEDIFSPHWRG